ncbi:mitotic checkpoint serine/threonine-protein kinase BUB1 beta [Brachyhypopomus gauderio]|uniref:mitotic checkpoint serine/threonine-protein kinase BUB1 beta n=1 Tax=Brachyhypopomus gauderio TaxID=698409 RepID=UPI0040435167
MEMEEPAAQQSSNCKLNPVESAQQTEPQDGPASHYKHQSGVQSMYSVELVSGGGTEFSFEELRAQRYFKQLKEKVLHLHKVKEELKTQIEQKQKLIQGRNGTTQDQFEEDLRHPHLQTAEGTCVPVAPTKTSPLTVYSEPEMPNSSGSRNVLVRQEENMEQGESAHTQIFQAPKLVPVYDENILSEKANSRSSSRSHKTLKLPTSILKARQTASECVGDKDSSISRSEEAIINGHWNKTLCRSPDDTCDFVHAAQMASTPFGGPVRQNPSERGQMEDQETLNKTSRVIFKEPVSDPIEETKKLSPIQEISQEWGYTSHSSLEPDLRGRAASHFGIPQESQLTRGRTQSSPAPETETMKPLSLEVRRALLDNLDLSSLANFNKRTGPLPEPEEDLHLDGEDLFFLRKFADPDIYLYFSNNGNVFVKVDRSSVPWDFYISSQLGARLPADLKHYHSQSTCYLYENGSLTLWRVSYGQTIQSLVEQHVTRWDAIHLAVRLLEMVKQMHSCHLVHGALRPETLLVCHSCEDRVVGMEFSGSLDLRLQTDVKTVQAYSPAQDYIRQGVLLPSASPYQVDLYGVAEIVYLLLAGRSMTLVKEGSSWSLVKDSHVSDNLDPLWEDFFHNILNPEDNTTETILLKLIGNLRNTLDEGLDKDLFSL